MPTVIDINNYRWVEQATWSSWSQEERQDFIARVTAHGFTPIDPVDGDASPRLLPPDGANGEDGGAAAINAVTYDGGSDAGTPIGDGATGLGLGWPDWGILAQTKQFPWLLLGAGLILMVMASRRHRGR
ncbi:hypothetical protein [Paramagnetospirillum magneticum]|uniref:Uncharacterized protein n=1 Tax=Paramagnetospirillum magneticum (strain ATCC 700264 / AMB-1) TaxID=342108 RepID=Q2W4K5_PARM1|nr:hypothetical protein [Paramagnetospirillum magneticum]BAE51220.1 hypothetical protein amb2416 [Paramagnetospirillum magneticum AMB-1]